MFLELLPFFSFLSIFILLSQRGISVRQALLEAAVIWGVFVVLISESLSWIIYFNKGGLIVSWVLVLLISLFLILKKSNVLFTKNFAKKLDLVLSLKALAALIFFVLVVTFISAWLTPPNNWDGHSYHLSRIMHWAQNQTITHYPTAMEKQLIFPPWAEFAISHSMILGETDRLSNLIQWFAFLLSLVAVSSLSEKMGLSFRGQLITVALAATLPMALLQSVTVQNDLITACWILIFINYWWDAVYRQDNVSALPVVSGINLFLGLSAGLAVLTKGTAPIYLFSFLIILFVRQFNRSKMKSMGQALFIGAVMLGLNLGHFSRNIQIFGVPLSTPPGLSLANEEVSLRVLLSNIVRNSLLHFPLPARFSGLTRSLVDLLHLPLGLDPLDPKTSFEGSTFSAPFIQISEHVAGNPVQMLLICIGIFFLVKDYKKGKFKLPKLFLMGLIGSVLLFCLLLKWQQYNSRLHLPFFFLVLPLAVMGIYKHSNLTRLGIGFALVVAVAPLFFSQTHPWFGNQSIFHSSKESLYFIERPELLSRFNQVAEEIKKKQCHKIGLIEAGDETWEYPLWQLLSASRDDSNTKYELRYIHIKKKSGQLETGHFEPCAVVSLAQVRLME